ncbi:MAG: hypothetical protein R3D00_28345 [Bacteroidia bacterium]
MKHLLPLWIVTLLFFYSYSSGQNRIAPEDSFPPSESRLFSLRVPEKQMIKLDLTNLIRISRNGYVHGIFRAGYERKIFTTWSLTGEISTSWYTAIGIGNLRKLYYAEEQVIGVAVGPRYYYGMQKRIREGRSADNLSANYLGLVLSTRLQPEQKGWTATDDTGILYSDNVAITPMLGFQRRILRYGFLDFSFGAKFSYGDPVRSKVFHPKGGEMGWQFLPMTSFRMGLAL